MHYSTTLSKISSESSQQKDRESGRNPTLPAYANSALRIWILSIEHVLVKLFKVWNVIYSITYISKETFETGCSHWQVATIPNKRYSELSIVPLTFGPQALLVRLTILTVESPQIQFILLLQQLRRKSSTIKCVRNSSDRKFKDCAQVQWWMICF